MPPQKNCQECNRPIKGYSRQGRCNVCYGRGLAQGTISTVPKRTKPEKPPLYRWDGVAELELLREVCRKDFWTFFLWCFGAGDNPKGQRWIDPQVHEPMARWFQQHVLEWLHARQRGEGQQKHLAILVHREVGKTTMFSQAGQAWLHLLDPEISTYTGSEKLELAMKIMAGVKAVFDGSDPYALFPKLYGNWATNARTWTGREVFHAGRRNTARRDPSFGTFGVETSIVGAHPDAIFYDDPISYERMVTDTNWLAAVNGQVTSLFPVIQSDGLVIWVGCIAVGTPVLMGDGTWKAIEEVKAGESVWTTDERGEAAQRKVEASLDQGVAPTVIVKTKSGDLRCTPWHPLLVARDGGLAWVRADALKNGDLVAAVKRAPSDPQIPWMTEDLAWLCGMILGDGWIGKNADYACIAMSKDESLNAKIFHVLEDWIPGSLFHRTAFGYLRCNSTPAAKAFRSLGLVGDAHTKRVPVWVFQALEEHRIAFLRGFCDADGCKVVRGDDSWRVEVSNEALISDLRLLARTCGVKPGAQPSIRERWIKAPNSSDRVRSRTSSSHFNFATIDREERARLRPGTGNRKLQEEAQSARLLGDGFRLDRVSAVIPAPECRVWDLTVEGSRSFVADGMVVHNTRYDDDDHFGVAFRDEGIASITGLQTDAHETTPDGKWHLYFLAGRNGEGTPTTPKVWPERRLLDFQRRDPLRYAAQVLNDPAISEFNPITKDQIKQCLVKASDVPWGALRYGICCDTAFWDGKSREKKDDTVFYVHGYPRNGSGDVYAVEGYGSATWRAEDLAKRLVAIVQRYRRQGRRIIGISDEVTMAGKKDAWRMALGNYFADVNEPMPTFYEFRRGGTKKVERMVAAASFWVDGHVKVVEGSPGSDRLMEQMSKIGQFMVNPRLKNDWVDAHSDAFQPEFYQPMRRTGNQKAPYEKGADAIEVEGLDRRMFDDGELGEWIRECPREPIKSW